jgi:hypothetical protein
MYKRSFPMKILTIVVIIVSIPLLIFTQQPQDYLQIPEMTDHPNIDGMADDLYGPQNTIEVVNEGEDEMDPQRHAWFDIASCNFKTALKEDETDYYIECSYDIDSLRLRGDDDGYFGVDCQINDGRNDSRENMLRWHTNSNDAWHWAYLSDNATFSNFEVIILKILVKSKI